MSNMIRWKLKEYLEERGITPYRLMVESGVSGNTIYRIKNGKSDTMQGKVINDIFNALHRLTGEVPTPNDLIEFIPDQQAAKHGN